MTRGPARAKGRLNIDRAALRAVLGGRPEVLEVLEAGARKAVGRPSANVSVLWRYFTTAIYASQATCPCSRLERHCRTRLTP